MHWHIKIPAIKLDVNVLVISALSGYRSLFPIDALHANSISWFHLNSVVLFNIFISHGSPQEGNFQKLSFFVIHSAAKIRLVLPAGTERSTGSTPWHIKLTRFSKSS